MPHIIGFLVELISTVFRYLSVYLILLFDAIIFAYPVIFINNWILNSVYSVPELNYFQGVGLIFLFKLIAVLWKNVKIVNEPEPEQIIIHNKEEKSN